MLKVPQTLKGNLRVERRTKRKKKKASLRAKMATMNGPKGMCFKCKHKGHWKNDCSKTGMGSLNVVEVCLV